TRLSRLCARSSRAATRKQQQSGRAVTPPSQVVGGGSFRIYGGCRARPRTNAVARACQDRNMPLIALTGGIASGKSTIAHGLEKHGAVIIDADQIVRDVQSPGSPVLQEIANAFGEDVIDASGALDRVALGARVF